MKYKKIDEILFKHQRRLASERDKLDATIDNLTDLKESCDEAWEELQRARDALSKFV